MVQEEITETSSVIPKSTPHPLGKTVQQYFSEKIGQLIANLLLGYHVGIVFRRLNSISLD